MKKKILALFLSLVMLLSLAACGGKNDKPADDKPDAPAEDQTTLTSLPMAPRSP